MNPASTPSDGSGGKPPEYQPAQAFDATLTDNSSQFDKKAALIPDIELGDLLGQGGMGVVYRGRQVFLDRTVAIKILTLPGGDLPSPVMIDRFQREAKILAGLSNKHIVACYQAGVAGDGRLYLVMEFIDGPNLKQHVLDHGKLTEAQALTLTRDLVEGLEHAHEKGIIHRDIKPENILLKNKPAQSSVAGFPFEVKLADLGIARYAQGAETEAAKDLTQRGALVGTPSAMAPEQFDTSKKVDFRTDLYCLGLVLFFALTGKPPFPQRTITELMKAKLLDPFPALPKVDPSVRPEVAALVKRLCAFQPEDRPQSHKDIIAACNRLLSQSEVTVPTVEPKKSVNKKAALIGPLISILLALAIIFGPTRREKQPNKTAPIRTPVATVAPTSEATPTSSPTPPPTPTPTPKPEVLFGEGPNLFPDPEVVPMPEPWKTENADGATIVGLDDERLGYTLSVGPLTIRRPIESLPMQYWGGFFPKAGEVQVGVLFDDGTGYGMQCTSHGGSITYLAAPFLTPNERGERKPGESMTKPMTITDTDKQIVFTIDAFDDRIVVKQGAENLHEMTTDKKPVEFFFSIGKKSDATIVDLTENPPFTPETAP